LAQAEGRQSEDQYDEELEKEHFLGLKQQLFEMLTKNKHSRFNNEHNLQSVLGIDIAKAQRHQHKIAKVSTTAYIEDEANEKVVGAYFLTHDTKYVPGHCFHVVRSLKMFL